MRFILLAVLLLAGGQAVANYSGIVWPEEEGITPLMEACRAGDCDRVRKLLAAKPDLERATWVYHRTVWDYAARSKRSYEVMTLLLEHGGRAPKSLELLEQLCCQWLWANPEECDTYRRSVFLLLGHGTPPDFRRLFPVAVKHGGIPMLTELQKHGADFNVRGAGGGTPLIVALKEAAPLETVEFLLRHGADPNACDFQGIPAVYYARGNAQLRLLLRYGARPQGVPGGRPSRLSDWAEWIDPELAETLLAAGCEPAPGVGLARNPELPRLYEMLVRKGVTMPSADSMAEWALEAGELANAEFLIGHGAKLKCPNLAGCAWQIGPLVDPVRGPALLKYLLDKKVLNINRCFAGDTVLSEALGFCVLPEVIAFLLDNGADPELPIPEHGQTALLRLLNSENWYGTPRKLELLELLIRHGVDFGVRDRVGATPLLVALAAAQPEELIRRLLTLTPQDINTPTQDGVTPLMLAALHGSPELVEELIGYGAEVEAVDVTGWTPLFYATGFTPVVRKNPLGPHRSEIQSPDQTARVIEILLKHGAQAGRRDRFGAVPLTQAAAWLDAATVERLVRGGGRDTVNCADGCGRTALLYAAGWNEDDRVARLLVEAGADCGTVMKTGPEAVERRACIPGTSWGRRGREATISVSSGPLGKEGLRLPPVFDSALRRGRPELFRLLPEADWKLASEGAKRAFRRNFEGNCGYADLKAVRTLWEMAAAVCPPEERRQLLHAGLMAALGSNRADVVRFLAGRCADSEPFGLEQLAAAVRNGRHPEVLRFVARQAPELLAAGRARAVELLVQAGSGEIVDFLVDSGFDVNAKDAEGLTPLLAACRNEKSWRERRIFGEWKEEETGKTAMLAALLRRGADVNAVDRMGRNAAFLLLDCRGVDNDVQIPLRLLFRHGLDPNVFDGKLRSLLECAIRRDSSVAFELLIDAGARPSAADLELARQLKARYIASRLISLAENQ